MTIRSLALALAALLVVGLPSLPRADDPPPRGWVGVYLGDDRSASGGEPGSRPGGVRVTGVIVGSPADLAGLRAQDLILAVDGTPVFSAPELVGSIGGRGPGEWVALSVQRGRHERDLTLRLDERPADPGSSEVRRAWLGVDTIELPPSLRLHFGAPQEAGVMVHEVIESSPAEIAGIEVGDVIYRVGEVEIVSSGILGRTVASGGVGNTLDVTLARNGAELTVEAVLSTRPERR